MKTVAQCQTLREYREDVLGLPQHEVARRAKNRTQAHVSRIERGHLPRRWNWEDFLKAYELSKDDFERLVTNTKKLAALQKPISETEPLMATARSGRLQGELASLYSEAPLIGEAEVLKARNA